MGELTERLEKKAQERQEEAKKQTIAAAALRSSAESVGILLDARIKQLLEKGPVTDLSELPAFVVQAIKELADRLDKRATLAKGAAHGLLMAAAESGKAIEADPGTGGEQGRHDDCA